MKEYWEMRADGYIQKHINAKGETRNHEWVMEWIKSSGYKRIMEAGCGTGESIFHYPDDMEVYAVDFMPKFIEIVKSRVSLSQSIHIESFNLVKENIKKKFGEFGLIWSMVVLQHIPPSDIERVIKNMVESARMVVLIEGVRGKNTHYSWVHDYKKLFKKYGMELFHSEKGGHPNTERMVFIRPIQVSNFTNTYITNKERLKWLKKSIDSVSIQEGVSFEHIIMDDGSTVQIPYEWIRKPHIRYFKVNHKGRAQVANLGVDKAFGEYRCFIADDDYLVGNDSLAIRYQLAKENPKVSLLYTNAYRVDENDNVIRESNVPDIEITKKSLLEKGGIINGASCIIKTDIWKKFKLNEEYTTAEEYDQQLRLADWSEKNGYCFKYFPRYYTVANRFHKGQGSRNLNSNQKKMRRLIVKRNLGNFPFEKTWTFRLDGKDILEGKK